MLIIKQSQRLLSQNLYEHENLFCGLHKTFETLLFYVLQVQRLAEIGEESVVVTANIVDGTHSVLSSDQGEKFLHDGVVSHFMDHFVRFLFTGMYTYYLLQDL